jgi:glycosyltransferase involved in cell wall biosynthesis
MIQPLRQPPSVDVVIPVRNRACFIGACLDSVRAQTLQPAAIIVVDDGSTDDTMAILDAYAKMSPKLRVIRTAPRGVSSARNTALAASTAQLVAFIDSDDVWLPEKLARQVALFTPDRPQLGLVHCGLRQIDEYGNPLRRLSPIWIPSKRGDIFSAMLNEFYHLAGSASAVVARRDLVMMVGGFDESLVQAEDRDLWMRLARVSHVDYVPDVLIGLRSHGENSYAQAMKNDPELVLFQRLQVWNKWFDDIKDLDAVLRTFRADALSTSISIMLRVKPDFGLYGHLVRSEMRIATMLFSGQGDYARGLLCFIVPRWLPVIPQIYELVKRVVAKRVILPNRRLLRIAQRFGRFRNGDTPASASGLVARGSAKPRGASMIPAA